MAATTATLTPHSTDFSSLTSLNELMAEANQHEEQPNDNNDDASSSASKQKKTCAIQWGETTEIPPATASSLNSEASIDLGMLLVDDAAPGNNNTRRSAQLRMMEQGFCLGSQESFGLGNNSHRLSSSSFQIPRNNKRMGSNNRSGSLGGLGSMASLSVTSMESLETFSIGSVREDSSFSIGRSGSLGLVDALGMLEEEETHNEEEEDDGESEAEEGEDKVASHRRRHPSADSDETKLPSRNETNLCQDDEGFVRDAAMSPQPIQGDESMLFSSSTAAAAAPMEDSFQLSKELKLWQPSSEEQEHGDDDDEEEDEEDEDTQEEESCDNE